MKNKLSNIVKSILVIILTIPLIFSGCGKKGNSDEIMIITNFIETFFTDPRIDNELYKEYFTSEAFKSFCDNRWSIGTFYPDKEATNNPDDRFGPNIEPEVSNLSITQRESSNEALHSYDVSFTLTEKNTNVEKNIARQLTVEKENNNWKLSYANRIDYLQGDLYSYKGRADLVLQEFME